MGRRILVLILLAVLVALEYGLLFYLLRGSEGEVPSEGGTSPLITVLSPPDNSVVIQGQTITVEVETRTTGRVIAAELWLDGKKALGLPSAIKVYSTRQVVDFAWEASLTGTHSLEVRLTDSEARRLTASLTIKVIPPLYLCFASNRDGDYEIYRMRADGTEIEKLTDNALQEREPSQAPDGSIAIASSADGLNWELVLLRDGKRRPLPGKGSRREPVFDPTGRYLLFVSAREGGEELFLLDLRTQEERPLTSGDAYAGQASWHPSGWEIAFTVLRQGNWDVYRINRDGSSLTRLTDHPAQDWHPAWSPDGSKIAFVSGRDGSHRLYLMNPDGTGVERISGAPDGVEQPVFSPDGKLLAFVAYTGKGQGVYAREIYVLPLDTGHPIRLTHNAYDDTDVTWCTP